MPRSRPLPGTPRAAAAVLAVLAAVLLAATGSQAGIYKWVDEAGRVHFAQELHQVPARFRRQAEQRAAAPQGPDPIQTYTAPASAAPPARRERSPRSARVHRIPVERAGTMLRVMVRINDRIDAPFFIDTGASDVVLPRAVAEQLGLELAGARTGVYGTANGRIEVPLVTLDSVALGSARAESIPAAVSDAMRVGLLGLSFFNRFQYQVDPARGVVTLVENGLVDAGHIRGGRSAPQWRAEFAALQARIAAVEAKRERTPDAHGREHARLREARAELDRQLELLEAEADHARVPFGWRGD